jgi:hypothetical protein
VFVPIRAVGDVSILLLLVVDSVAALDSSRVGIVRVESVGSFELGVIDDGCSFYVHLYGSRNFVNFYARFAFQILQVRAILLMRRSDSEKVIAIKMEIHILVLDVF